MSSNKKTLIDGDFQVGSSHLIVDTDNNYVGFNNATPQNKIDVQIGVRTGTHSTGKPLYVTGVTSTSGAEFVSDDGTAGIGIGSSNIFTTETNQNLTIAPDGTGAVGIKTATPNPSGETFDLWVQGDTKITGNVTAGHIYGDGSALTNISGTQWVSSSEDIYFLNNTGSGEGRVGIGKTVPEYKLDILDSGKPTIRVKSTSTGDGDALLILDSSATGESDIEFNHDGVLNWRIRTGDASASGTSFQVNNANDSDVLTIQQNGDVGIGTDSPNVPLEVNKSAGGEMFRLATSTGTLYAGVDANPPWFGTSSDDHLRLVTNGTEKVRIESGGRVGIGTTDPEHNLHVRGSGGVRIGVESTGGYGGLELGGANGGLIDFKTPFSDDNDSRILYNGADLKFSGSNVSFDTDTLFVDTVNSRVGVGTTNPLEKLDVRGTIITPVVSYSSDQDAPYLIAGTPGYTGASTNWNTYGFQHRIKSNSGGTPRITVDASSGGEVFTIVNGGNVGIGVADPPCKLTIDGGTGVNSGGGVLAIRQKGDTINDGITLTSSSPNSTRLYKDGNGHFYIHTGGSDTVFQNQTGNVGIGTTSPQQKLEVHGNILLGQNDIQSFIHCGADMALSSDNDVLIVSDANDITGSAGADIIFGAGSAINMDSSRNFTFAQAYPSAVPRLEYMRIKGSGNVGIGTTSPSTDLQIGNTYNKTSDTYLTIASDGGNAYAQGIRLIHHGTDNTSMYGWRIRGDDTDDCFHINRINQGSQQTSALTIKNNGNVGIGTTSPRNKLEIKTTGTDSGLLHLFKTTGNGVGIDFCDQNSFLQKGFLRYHHQDSQALGARNCFRFSTTELTETLACGGSLLIGVDGKDLGYMTNTSGSGRKNLFIQSTFGNNTSQTHGWWIGAQNQTPTSSDNDLYFAVVRSGTIKLCATMLDQNNAQLNFTGQHRTFVKDTPTSQLVDKEGLIVVADQNEFVKMSGGVAYGKDAITINESLPLVSLSTKSNDKKCFGVLSTTEDPETRKEVYGNFASHMHKEDGDTRVYVNSVGEGAIWVVNTNGTLESGDYITTSNVVGYGMKQDDDILHNYTVAKILMDCDFNPVTQPKRTIRKESRMIDYWIRYGDVKITEEEYQTLPETNRKIVEDVHYRIDQMEVVKENPEKDTFVYEQREEMVNVLDEHGQIQWEDSSETEKAYKIRYLDADGNITDEVNHVHKAAFVGCTYHCG